MKSKKSEYDKKRYQDCKEALKQKRELPSEKERIKEYNKNYGKENYLNLIPNFRNRHYKKRYGITLEDYNIIFSTQEGKCAICNVHQSDLGKALAVDHCHTTNAVRGLLCSDCNLGLGKFKDSIQLLTNAKNYLTP